MYKLTSYSDLKIITEQIGDALDMPVYPSDTTGVIGKINLLSMLLGASSHAVALAERKYNKKMLNLMSVHKWGNFPPYEKKLIFDGLAYDEAYYVTLTQGQNSALKYALYSLEAMMYAPGRY